MDVVNVKVANIRPVYQNLSEWMADENNVYIGRRGVVFINGERFPKNDSIWANPFKIREGGLTRSEVIQKYEDHIVKILDDNSEMCQKLLELKGKRLGCWCKPEPCHGDILVKLFDKYHGP